MILILFSTVYSGLVIPSNCFNGCLKLKKVIISPSSKVTRIESNAFANCTLLDSVTFSVNTVEIADSAFSGCTSLRSIVIPQNLNALGVKSFTGCGNLTNMHYCGDNANLFNNKHFDDIREHLVIFVKKNFSTTNITTLTFRKVLEENCLLEFKPTYCEPAAKTSNNILPVFLLIEGGFDFKYGNRKRRNFYN